MMNNQYKDQLSSIKVSEDFKQSLKEMMAKEIANQATTVIGDNGNKINWNKYSRYIACAACLAMILATVGITTAINSGFTATKSFDNAESESNLYMLDSATEENPETNPDAIGGIMTKDNDSVVEEVEEEVEEDIPDNGIPAVESEVEEAETVAEESVSDMPIEEDEEVELAEPMTNNDAVAKSVYSPENYDGEYFAEDYVYITEGSGSIEALSVWENENSDISYNSVCDNILADLGEVGLVKFDILEVMPAEAANAIANDSNFSAENTMYRTELIYDYLTNDPADGEMYMALYGNELIQEQGLPMFEVGDTVLAVVDPKGEYCEIVKQLVYEVHRVNGIDIAYHPVYENVDPGYTNMGILDMETNLVTSTSNNPAEYVHKAAVKELTRYLRRNFNKREIPYADMTVAGDIIGEEIIDIEQTAYEGGLAISSRGISLTCDGNKLAIGDIGKDIVFTITKGTTSTADGVGIVTIGGSKLYFDNALPYSGKLYKLDITQSSDGYPVLLNGITAGDGWSKVMNAFSIDIPHIETGICDIDVLSGDEVSYRITFTVESGIVTQIVIDSNV